MRGFASCIFSWYRTFRDSAFLDLQTAQEAVNSKNISYSSTSGGSLHRSLRRVWELTEFSRREKSCSSVRYRDRPSKDWARQNLSQHTKVLTTEDSFLSLLDSEVAQLATERASKLLQDAGQVRRVVGPCLTTPRYESASSPADSQSKVCDILAHWSANRDINSNQNI